MPQSVDEGKFHAMLPTDNPSDEALTNAYTSTYGTLDRGALAPKGTFTTLSSAHANWKDSSLSNNKKAVENAQASEQKEVSGYLELKIQNIKLEIKDLEDLLPTTKAFLPEVLDEKGMQIADNDLKKTPGGSRFLLTVSYFADAQDLLKPPTMEITPADELSAWTRV